MPLNLSGVTEDQVRSIISGGNFAGFSPGAAEQYASQFPGLSAELAPFLAPAAPASTPTGAVPTGTSPTGGGAPTTPFNLTGWDEINQFLQSSQQQANLGRIPGAAGLEQSSSDVIAQLLNPGSSFADVNRQAAELGAMRGIGGSAAAVSTGYRMTDEERLKRMALGQQMLSAAYARNPSAELLNPAQFLITPYQQAQLDLERDRQNLAEEEWDWRRNRLEQPNITYSGMGQQGGQGRAGGGAAASPVYPTVPAASTPYPTADDTGVYGENPYFNWPYEEDVYDPSGGYLPLYPGGSPVSGDIYDYPAVNFAPDYGGGFDLSGGLRYLGLLRGITYERRRSRGV